MLKSFMRHYSTGRLERDSHSIIQADEIGHKPRHVRQIAQLLDEYIGMSRRQRPIKGERLLNIIRKKHRMARKQHKQVELSATTLAIIYFKARELGEKGQHICENLDSFINKWKTLDE